MKSEMTFYLSGLNSIVLFLILFVVICSYTIIGLSITYLFFDGQRDNWTGSRFLTSFFTIVGALLGLVLAMVLVSVWQNYQKEKQEINTEVSNLTMLYIDAGGLSQEERNKVRIYLKNLTRTIIQESWPKMAKGEVSIVPGIQMAILYKYLGNMKSQDIHNKLFAIKMMSTLEKVSEIRKNRNLSATQSLIPPLMWLIIIICALISISCGFFFHIKPFWLHVVLSLLHSSMITIIIFLILSMMYPYRGGSSIDSGPYQELLTKTYPIIDKAAQQANN